MIFIAIYMFTSKNLRGGGAEVQTGLAQLFLYMPPSFPEHVACRDRVLPPLAPNPALLGVDPEDDLSPDGDGSSSGFPGGITYIGHTCGLCFSTRRKVRFMRRPTT